MQESIFFYTLQQLSMIKRTNKTTDNIRLRTVQADSEIQAFSKRTSNVISWSVQMTNTAVQQ